MLFQVIGTTHNTTSATTVENSVITQKTSSTIEESTSTSKAKQNDGKSTVSKDTKQNNLTNEATSSSKDNVVAKEVITYFAGTPELIDVAWCESRYRQTDKDGNIFRGEANNKDVGVMQINESFHLERSKNLGYDIYTLKGNMAYAKKLYDEQGLQPWVSSKPCWGSRIKNTDSENDKVALVKN